MESANPVMEQFTAARNHGEDHWEALTDTWINADHADANVNSAKSWRQKAATPTSTTMIFKMENTFVNIEPDHLFELLSNIPLRLKWDPRWIDGAVLE